MRKTHSHIYTYTTFIIIGSKDNISAVVVRLPGAAVSNTGSREASSNKVSYGSKKDAESKGESNKSAAKLFGRFPSFRLGSESEV